MEHQATGEVAQHKRIMRSSAVPQSLPARVPSLAGLPSMHIHTGEREVDSYGDTYTRNTRSARPPTRTGPGMGTLLTHGGAGQVHEREPPGPQARYHGLSHPRP